MSKTFYKKATGQGLNKKKFGIRVIGFVLFFFGITLVLYIFAPLVLWQIFLEPALASQQIVMPIPTSNFITPGTIRTLLSAEVSSLNVDYNDAKNWFPYVQNTVGEIKIPYYKISIPKLNITGAQVSAVDTDLAHHLVQFPGTASPSDRENTVIIGHSTLPSLYNFPKDYKTIFAYAHTLNIGDKIVLQLGNITYHYKIFSITIVDPANTSIFAQPVDDSYITIVTCTPPGTIWKRLVISSRLESL